MFHPLTLQRCFLRRPRVLIRPQHARGLEAATRMPLGTEGGQAKSNTWGHPRGEAL